MEMKITDDDGNELAAEGIRALDVRGPFVVGEYIKGDGRFLTKTVLRHGRCRHD